MGNGFNFWLHWEAYKLQHPELRQVLEWQEQDYRRFCECPQNGERKGGEKECSHIETKEQGKYIGQ